MKRRMRTAREAKVARDLRSASALDSGRLEELVKASGSRGAFARALGVTTSDISNWLDNGIAPRAKMLADIVRLTGCSIDWLLGFDVPADIGARTESGDLARTLFQSLIASAPPFAPKALLGNPIALDDEPGRSAQLVRSVSESWWELERQNRATRFGQALRSLADRLDDASSEVSDPRVGTHMLQQARQLRNRSVLLRAGDASWRDMLDLSPGRLCVEVPGVAALALKNRDESVTAYLQAPFPALGGQAGIGAAWHRESTKDEAWFIDPESLEVRHEHGRRFLVPLTITDRFPPLSSVE